MDERDTIFTLSESLRSGNRRALAKAISLIESTLEQDIERRNELLTLLLPYTGNSKRIGITGSPGAGKSTFIESFGLYAIEQNKKVAVLAIDPTSSRSGGSILGDKIRMPKLSVHENAFIRPSATSGSLGGATRRTREAILLCEAAGYDYIIVETVGVGQSETAVSEMVDTVILLQVPIAGDDIQGIKRGIMETADIVVITKSDLNITQTLQAQSYISSVLRLLPPTQTHWQRVVTTCSALTNVGINTIYEQIVEFHASYSRQVVISKLRENQDIAWYESILEYECLSLLLSDPRIKQFVAQAKESIRLHQTSATISLYETMHFIKSLIAQ